MYTQVRTGFRFDFSKRKITDWFCCCHGLFVVANIRLFPFEKIFNCNTLKLHPLTWAARLCQRGAGIWQRAAYSHEASPVLQGFWIIFYCRV